MFSKPTKLQKRLRLALSGPSGSGKTYSALAIAASLGGSIAVIDTEHNSSALYCDQFEFMSCDLKQHHPSKYIEAIRAANEFDVIVIDSLTHAWYAELEMAEGNFKNWAKVRPIERQLIEEMLSSPAHLIITMRSKTEYAIETNKNGKPSPVKVGTAPIQSSGIEYEFDIVGDINLDHVMAITKSRCQALVDTRWLKPGQEFGDTVKAWLTDGAPLPESPQEKVNRVKEAMEKYIVSREDALKMMAKYNADNPSKLTSAQVDELIEKMKPKDKATV